MWQCTARLMMSMVVLTWGPVKHFDEAPEDLCLSSSFEHHSSRRLKNEECGKVKPSSLEPGHLSFQQPYLWGSENLSPVITTVPHSTCSICTFLNNLEHHLASATCRLPSTTPMRTSCTTFVKICRFAPKKVWPRSAYSEDRKTGPITMPSHICILIHASAHTVISWTWSETCCNIQLAHCSI